MYRILSKLYKCSLLVICSAFVGFIALVAVYFLPVEPMHKNLQSAIDLYQRERDYPRWAGDHAYSSQFDNFTDSVMLRTAIFPITGSIIRSAMMNPYYIIKGKISPTQMLVEQLKNDKKNKSYFYTYGRYWHGYLVLLKPALRVGSISTIRLVNSVLQLSIAFLCCLLFFQKLGAAYCVAFISFYFILNPITIAMQFHFSTMYYLSTAFSLVTLTNDRVLSERRYLLFCLAGIMTAFFDLLSTPLLSLGIPLIIILVRQDRQKELLTYSKALWLVAESSFFWGFGYFFMWVSKWILGSCLTHSDIISNALKSAKYRTSPAWGTRLFTRFEAIKSNCNVLFREPIIYIWLLFLIISVIYMLAHRCFVRTDKYPLVLSLLIITTFPFLWYCVLPNHSYIHPFFTFRNLSITVFAFSCCVAAFLSKQSS